MGRRTEEKKASMCANMLENKRKYVRSSEEGLLPKKKRNGRCWEIGPYRTQPVSVGFSV